MNCSLYRGSRVLLGALLALAVVGCDVSSRKEKKEAQAMNLPNEIKQAAALVDWIKSEGSGNDLKRDEEFKALKGKYVVFAGKVREVGKTAFLDKPYVSLTVGEKSAFERINIQFNVPKELVKTVSEWKKGEVHVLRGRVSEKGDLTDDATCDNCEIVPEDKYKAVLATIPDSSESKEPDVRMQKMKQEMKDRLEKARKDTEGALNDAMERMKNIKAEDVETKLNEGVEAIKNLNTDDVKKGLEDAGNMLKSFSF